MLIGDRFRALKIIGRGAFGKTFLAVDESLPDKPRCVIKQFLPFAFANTEKASDLFQQEARRLETLGHHPQIPTFIAYYEQDERQYIVQEFIDGQNLLGELEEQGVFSETKIYSLLRDLLPVLGFIHRHQVIHRDIKPENIIRRRTPADPSLTSNSSSVSDFVLVDFGAAKYVTGSALIKTGTSIGSAEYVAPEQARGKAEFASDIYSLGVTCIHLLTNTSPFNAIDRDNNWVWRDWLNDNQVGDHLTYILNKMISPLLSQRYPSVAFVNADLRHPSPLTPAKQSQWQKRNLWLALGAIAATSVTTIAVFLGLRRSAPSLEEAVIPSLEEAAMEHIFNLYSLQSNSYIQNGSFLIEGDVLPFSKGYDIFVTKTGINGIRLEAHPNQPNLKSLIAVIWGGERATVKPNPNQPFVLDTPNFDNSTRTTLVLYCESDRPTMEKFIHYPTLVEQNQPFDYQDMQCPPGYSYSYTAATLLGKGAARMIPARVMQK
ncbi:MAG: serine/threonine-protein kinase [Synechocystis sp.]|nr:serine/threonine-protein kinase [Synechocystis sp.]